MLSPMKALTLVYMYGTIGAGGFLMALKLNLIKPNPSGKDRPPYGGPTPSQLAAEWIDLYNSSLVGIALDGLSLWHQTFASGQPNGWAKVTGFVGTLPAGKSVRVHAGQARPLTVIRKEDLDGADFHLFSGEDAFVWNNANGDRALLYRESNKDRVDTASYRPNPPEGVTLSRVGDEFLAVQYQGAYR